MNTELLYRLSFYYNSKTFHELDSQDIKIVKQFRYEYRLLGELNHVERYARFSEKCSINVSNKLVLTGMVKINPDQTADLTTFGDVVKIYGNFS